MAVTSSLARFSRVTTSSRRSSRFRRGLATSPSTRSRSPSPASYRSLKKVSTMSSEFPSPVEPLYRAQYSGLSATV